MRTSDVSLRLLCDPPLDGPTNMARDEALLAAVGDGASPPTLRFYAWRPATVSLGYFQAIAEFESLAPPAGGLAVVRRTTGGGAILHDLELTYSLAMPAGHVWLAGGATTLYECMHRAIIAAVGGSARLHGCDGAAGGACGEGAQRGPFFCFARRHALDVVMDGTGAARKLAGSAQRRTPRAVLQHGSLILDTRYPQQTCATWRELGGPAEPGDAADRLAAAMTDTHGCRLRAGEWRGDELWLAESLLAKYSGDNWTRRR